MDYRHGLTKLIAYHFIIVFFFLLTSCPGTPAVYTLTYSSPEASVSAVPSSETTTTSVAELPDDPLREGYGFRGWWTEPNGGGVEFTPSTILTSDLIVYAHWAAASPGLSYRLNPYDNLYSVSSGSFYAGTLVIPGLWQGQKVVYIEDNAFNTCTEITGTLRLPSEITYIGRNAFTNCTGLTGNLILPKKAGNIESFAFAGCSGIDGTLYFPKGLIMLGNYAFSGCTKLINFKNFPDNLFELPQGAFYNCSFLSDEIVFPERIATIGSDAFYNCTKLSKITLRCTSQIVSGLNNTFTNCPLISIKVPASLVDAYKVDPQWVQYASIISAID